MSKNGCFKCNNATASKKGNSHSTDQQSMDMRAERQNGVVKNEHDSHEEYDSASRYLDNYLSYSVLTQVQVKASIL